MSRVRIKDLKGEAVDWAFLQYPNEDNPDKFVKLSDDNEDILFWIDDNGETCPKGWYEWDRYGASEDDLLQRVLKRHNNDGNKLLTIPDTLITDPEPETGKAG